MQEVEKVVSGMDIVGVRTGKHHIDADSLAEIVLRDFLPIFQLGSVNCTYDRVLLPNICNYG